VLCVLDMCTGYVEHMLAIRLRLAILVLEWRCQGSQAKICVTRSAISRETLHDGDLSFFSYHKIVPLNGRRVNRRT
jgi:hypothetical protein